MHRPARPYCQTQARRIPLWRLILALLTLILGVFCSAMGVFAVAVMTYVIWVEQSVNHIDDMYAGCILYLGPGIIWVGSSILLWIGLTRVALCMTLVGILIPIILFSIKGF